MDKYEIKSKLGVGAHGSVFLVQHTPSKKLFALKKVEVDERKKSRSKESVLKEASILSQLKHPHIVLFHESFWNPRDECVCIILDYCAGGNLADKISAAQQVDIPFTEKEIMQWFIQVVMAVQYIHSKHILHRDLKSENVFLNKRNIIKVGDFGISKVLMSTIDVAKTVVGTPSYLSPELCQDIPYNSKSDIWAVGCLLYELCSLSRPFDGNSLIGLMFNIVKAEYKPLPPDVPEGARDLVGRILVKVPENRLSASAVLNHPYVKKNLASFISDTENILYIRGRRGGPLHWQDDRGDNPVTRPQSAPPPKKQFFAKAEKIPPARRKRPEVFHFESAAKHEDKVPLVTTLPEPIWDDSKPVTTTTKPMTGDKTSPVKSDDPTYYSDDFDESSDSEIEEEMQVEVEEKGDAGGGGGGGKSEEEVYADDFEEYHSDEDLDMLVAQAKEAQALEPMDEYFLEPDDDLGLSQTLAMVQAGLRQTTNTSTC